MRGSRWPRWVARVSLGAAVGMVLSTGVAAASLPLSGQAVGSPGSGAVLTAEGTGGATPTTVEPGVDPTSEPTVPTLYLKPVALTTGGSQAAFWKVWWSGAVRTKYVVSLQQHVDAAHAQSEAQQLDQANRSPTSVQSASSWSYASSFTVPSVPGAVGTVWTATIGGVSDEFRFAVFTRGDLVELVSATTYGGPTSASELDTFALAQYDHSAGGGIPEVVWIVVALVVASLGWTVARSRRKARRRREVGGYGSPSGPAWAGYGPPPGAYGPPPNPYGPPPNPYGPPPGADGPPPGAYGPPPGAYGPPPGAYGPPPSPYGPPPGMLGPPPSPQGIGPPGAYGPGSTPPDPVLPSFGAFMAPASTFPTSGATDPPATDPPATDPPATDPPTTDPPAGWFPDPQPDPSRPGRQRYWDGGAWTDHFHPS